MIWRYIRQHQQPNGVWDDGPIGELPTGDDLRLLAELAKRKRQPAGSYRWNFFHSTSNLSQASTLAAVILNTTDIAGSECDKQVTFMFLNTTQTMHCSGKNTNTILAIYNICSSGFHHNSSRLSCNDAIVNLFGNIGRSNEKFSLIGYIKGMSIMVKPEKNAVFDKRKMIFALYAMCTVKYFGNMSGSINLKEIEIESG